ncbi:hypothetical protein ACL7TT_16165 [Microbulbifer sp. 2304DJ12-6]|uniref:hypothetical protein n=1 Tax=Microbulbifer sp. 2304DJ12-6 TaxID=3233340 RepID=UPI0039B06840
MITFSRYTHVNDIVSHYMRALGRADIKAIMDSGISNPEEAELFSRFIWEVVGQMNLDEENGIEVLGQIDNSEMIPDIHYEISKLMRDSGYYKIWEKVSNEEI